MWNEVITFPKTLPKERIKSRICVILEQESSNQSALLEVCEASPTGHLWAPRSCRGCDEKKCFSQRVMLVHRNAVTHKHFIQVYPQKIHKYKWNFRVKFIQRTCSIQLSSKQKRTGRHERSDSDRSAENVSPVRCFCFKNHLFKQTGWKQRRLFPQTYRS